MSLDVTPELLETAQKGEVGDAAFVECIKTSLPYAWDMISGLVARLQVDGGDFADNLTPPPDEQAAASCSGSSRATPCGTRWSATSA